MINEILRLVYTTASVVKDISWFSLKNSIRNSDETDTGHHKNVFIIIYNDYYLIVMWPLMILMSVFSCPLLLHCTLLHCLLLLSCIELT